MFEITPRYLIFLLISLLMVSCSHIQPHPDFWKSSRIKKNTVEKTKIVFEPIQNDLGLQAPSFSLSEWTLSSKSSFASRDYRLVLRDQSGNLIDSNNAPEIKIDGPAKLMEIKKISSATWNVKLEYLYDPAIIKIGLQLGLHRLENFRQIHYQMHELDWMNSKSFTQKSRVRADGVDKLRVYVNLKDKRGYSIFSMTDYQLQISVDQLNAKVEGPFSSSGGSYFEISSKIAGPIKYSVEVDGEILRGEGVARFIVYDRRSPAAEQKNCLEDLALIAGIKVPQSGPLEAYQTLADRILAVFEESQDSSSERFQFVLDSFSSERCTSNKIWDAAREEAGRELRQIHRRISR